MALCTPYDVAYSENVEVVIDKIIQEPRVLSNNRSSDISIVKPIVGFRNGLLLITTLIAAITCQVPFHILGSTSEAGYVQNHVTGTYQMDKQDSIICSSFILFNSMVFIASVSITIFLLHEFPLKPWPQVSILVLFCSYMCSLNVILPNEAPVLFFVSIPILLACICRITL